MLKKIILIFLLVLSVNADSFNFKNISINSDDAKGRGLSYNFSYSKNISFLNGKISVEFKAISGEEDQGGGIMYRVVDDNNYYVVRFNPLEDNLRVYYVKNSRRVLLKSADKRLDTKEWHTIKLIQNQNRYTIFLDGEKLLEGSDNTFTKAGGIGVWSKADALTSFKNLKVQKR